jgi:2,4-diketo-3-deoxy-L-fuconate hydrolase
MSFTTLREKQAFQRVSPNKALGHIAGYMTTNDVSCRTLTFRNDRPAMHTDWLGGKSLDTFAPTGRFFVPVLL